MCQNNTFITTIAVTTTTATTTIVQFLGKIGQFSKTLVNIKGKVQNYWHGCDSYQCLA